MTFQDDNGNTLEFDGGFAITKQAVSFFNGSIKGDVSINFEIDNNSVNRKTLNYSGPQMTSQVAFTKQPFKRMIDGNVLDRGYIVIQDETEDSLNCFYVSGNSNWIQLVTGLINKLDYTGVTNGTDYNTLLTAASVTARASATDGIIFPMVDWCYNGGAQLPNLFMTAGTLRVRDVTGDYINTSLFNLYPCFYLSTLVMEIAKQSGLKIAGNILNDGLYKSLVVTPTNGQMRRESFKNVNALGSAQSFASGVTQKYTSFTETQDPDNLFSNNTYTANKKASLYFTITNLSRTGTGITSVSIYKNGVLNQTTAWTNDGFKWTSSLVNCVFGDTFEIYVTNAVGPAYSATLNMTISVPEVVGIGDYVNPSHFLPELTCSDVIKFVIGYFGCSVYFDEYSKTLTLNIVENIKKESALDWSEYYLNHRSEYTVSQAKNNYLRLEDNDIDSDISNYNSTHLVRFGEGNIKTGNTLNADNEIVAFPFLASPFGLSPGGVYQTSVPLINLVDDGEPVPFSAVSSLTATVSYFDTTVKPTALTAPDPYEVVRIVNSSGINLGYNIVVPYVGLPPDPDNSVCFLFPFVSTFSGYIYRQTINYQDVGARILTVKPNTAISDFSGYSTYTLIDETGASTTPSTIPFATFTKTVTGKPIDQWKSNCAIDNPDSGGFTDPTVKELYFNKISRFIQNPNIRAQMLIPVSVFQSFDFSNFVYLRTEKLTGYFFVDSIVNYQDGNTPVEVNLYML